MSKKAQGISMNVIIIAALALIVLVVLVMIFTGRIGMFTGGVKSCSAMAGFCVDDEDACKAQVIDADGDGEKIKNKDYKGGLYNDDGCEKYCCQGLRKQS
jgi:hypothetical protein